MIWYLHQLSVREIGRRLGRSHSTICREQRRNVMPHNSYGATTAHRKAFDAARRARPGELSSAGLLRARVTTGLKDKLSPDQISGRLRRDYPTELVMRVAHETIYQALYSVTRNTLTRSVAPVIRTRRTVRKGRRKAIEGRGRIQT